MGLFNYSESKSDRLMASALLHCMNHGEISRYKIMLEIFDQEFNEMPDPIDPKDIKVRRMKLTFKIKEFIKNYKWLHYKTTSEDLKKLIEELDKKLK